VHCARTAATDSATVFCAGKFEVVSERPQQWCVWLAFELNRIVINLERNHIADPLEISAMSNSFLDLS
jgi:hypothetical protein